MGSLLRSRVWASQPAAPGLILGIPEELFILEIYALSVVEIHRQLSQWPVQDLNKLEPMHLVLLDSDTQNGLFEIGCCKSVFFLLTSFYLYNEEESIFA